LKIEQRFIKFGKIIIQNIFLTQKAKALQIFFVKRLNLFWEKKRENFLYVFEIKEKKA